MVLLADDDAGHGGRAQQQCKKFDTRALHPACAQYRLGRARRTDGSQARQIADHDQRLFEAVMYLEKDSMMTSDAPMYRNEPTQKALTSDCEPTVMT